MYCENVYEIEVEHNYIYVDCYTPVKLVHWIHTYINIRSGYEWLSSQAFDTHSRNDYSVGASVKQRRNRIIHW